MSNTSQDAGQTPPNPPENSELGLMTHENFLRAQVGDMLGPLQQQYSQSKSNERDRQPVQSWDIGGPAKQSYPGFPSSLGHGWDTLVSNVREVTPAFVINNGSRFNFGFRAAADAASIISGQRFDSPYRVAASSISLAALCLGLFFREEAPTAERQEQMEKMPVGEYLMMRVKDSFDPRHHITATVGMATIPNGILMAMSGMKTRVPGKTPWELYQGLMTVAAGLSLNFIPNQERAWQVAHGIFTIRAPFAAAQAHTAYYHGTPKPGVDFPRDPAMFREDWKVPPGDYMQAVKFAFNQTSNIFGFFYGGIHKDPDGTIISLSDKAKRDAGIEINVPEKAAISGLSESYGPAYKSEPRTQVTQPAFADRLQAPAMVRQQ